MGKGYSIKCMMYQERALFWDPLFIWDCLVVLHPLQGVSLGDDTLIL